MFGPSLNTQFVIAASLFDVSRSCNPFNTMSIQNSPEYILVPQNVRLCASMQIDLGLSIRLRNKLFYNLVKDLAES